METEIHYQLKVWVKILFLKNYTFHQRHKRFLFQINAVLLNFLFIKTFLMNSTIMLSSKNCFQNW